MFNSYKVSKMFNSYTVNVILNDNILQTSHLKLAMRNRCPQLPFLYILGIIIRKSMSEDEI